MQTKIIFINPQQKDIALETHFHNEASVIAYNFFLKQKEQHFQILTGFYNIHTQKIILRDFCSPEDTENININNTGPGQAWQGFEIHYSNELPDEIRILPFTTLYGRIPEERQTDFKLVITSVFGKNYSSIQYLKPDLISKQIQPLPAETKPEPTKPTAIKHKTKPSRVTIAREMAKIILSR